MKKKQRTKVIFVIPTLDAGGAERVMSFIAENLDKNRFETQLLVIGFNKNQAYSVKDIPVYFLNKNSVRNGMLSIVRYLIFTKVDIVISAIGHLNIAMSIISIFFPNTKFVGRETIVRSGKKSYIKDSTNVSWTSRMLANLPPKHLDAIICQSNDMRDDLIENYDYPKEKLVVLNNPVTSAFEPKEKKIHNGPIRFITIGRLEKQKGYERLINTLARYKFDYHYTIIGSGSLESEIKDLIAEHNLEAKFTHIPYTDDIPKFLAKSDFYLQGSYVEGFPNALLESCAVGTPVLAFDALGGINEIIQENVNGFIAENEVDFLFKLKLMIEKEWNPKVVNHSVTSRYSEDIIISAYEEFLNKLAHK